MFDALIMAGGRSQRMRTSGDQAHKALVRILGVPLVERNLRILISSGFANVAVAVSAHEGRLKHYLRTDGARIARELGGTCAIIDEQQPLGTIGAAREVPFADSLLVVNVDNLTGLPLAAFEAHHRKLLAHFTIAAHREPLPLDFGELVVQAGNVLEYREKPVRHPLVSSGAYVLSREAVLRIQPGERIGIPALFSRLRASDLRTVAFEHDDYWIDVNDRRAVERAESLLSSQALHR